MVLGKAECKTTGNIRIT